MFKQTLFTVAALLVSASAQARDETCETWEITQGNTRILETRLCQYLSPTTGRYHAVTQIHNLTTERVKVRYVAVCASSNGFSGLKRVDSGEWSGRASAGTCAEPWHTINVESVERDN